MDALECGSHPLRESTHGTPHSPKSPKQKFARQLISDGTMMEEMIAVLQREAG
jgi:hypothetical protein